jgi:hypothetical protein
VSERHEKKKEMKELIVMVCRKRQQQQQLFQEERRGGEMEETTFSTCELPAFLISDNQQSTFLPAFSFLFSNFYFSPSLVRSLALLQFLSRSRLVQGENEQQRQHELSSLFFVYASERERERKVH